MIVWICTHHILRDCYPQRNRQHWRFSHNQATFFRECLQSCVWWSHQAQDTFSNGHLLVHIVPTIDVTSVIYILVHIYLYIGPYFVYCILFYIGPYWSIGYWTIVYWSIGLLVYILYIAYWYILVHIYLYIGPYIYIWSILYATIDVTSVGVDSTSRALPMCSFFTYWRNSVVTTSKAGWREWPISAFIWPCAVRAGTNPRRPTGGTTFCFKVALNPIDYLASLLRRGSSWQSFDVRISLRRALLINAHDSA